MRHWYIAKATLAGVFAGWAVEGFALDAIEALAPALFGGVVGLCAGVGIAVANRRRAKPQAAPHE